MQMKKRKNKLVKLKNKNMNIDRKFTYNKN